jgi:hypothetical protein
LAVTPNTDEAFLREVDEELRRDQLVSFWRRWGRWLVAALVAALAIFAAILFWINHREVSTGQQGEQLQGVIDDLNANKPVDQATKPLAGIADSRAPGYRASAAFAQADVLIEKGDAKGAAAKLGAIAADGSLAQPFRDLALVRQTTLQFDQLKPQVVVDRLRPLADKDSPWFGSAGELVGMAYIEMNRRDLAAKLFSEIAAGDDVPDSIRQRAVQMASVLQSDASAAPSKDKKTQ